METLFNRYRNISILVVVILVQLVALAYQVRGNSDLRLVRIALAAAVSPLAQVIEGVRTGVKNTVGGYFARAGAEAENRRLKEELGKLKLENLHLRSELETAQRAEALQAFQKRSPSKTLAARVIGSTAGASSRIVFIDRGSTSGVKRGMAVITPDGIVGKVTESYPTASTVQLITDPVFAAGVVAQRTGVVGTLKGQGRSTCIVDYVPLEQSVEVGDAFFTSGDDRIFPKGLPVGRVSAVRDGRTFKEIILEPSGFEGGLEEVLVIVEGAHQAIPTGGPASSELAPLLPAPPGAAEQAAKTAGEPALQTDADRLRKRYQEAGDAWNYKYGTGMTAPDFTRKPAGAPPAAASPKTTSEKPPAAAAGAPPPP
jgi:rod shape-determining protein MreC